MLICKLRHEVQAMDPEQAPITKLLQLRRPTFLSDSMNNGIGDLAQLRIPEVIKVDTLRKIQGFPRAPEIGSEGFGATVSVCVCMSCLCVCVSDCVCMWACVCVCVLCDLCVCVSDSAGLLAEFLPSHKISGTANIARTALWCLVKASRLCIQAGRSGAGG